MAALLLAALSSASAYLMRGPKTISMPLVTSSGVLRAVPFVKSDPSQTDVNWVTAGMVTPVRDQGSCGGGGWAFATTSAIESMYLITNQGGASNSSLALSPQHLISCIDSANGFSSTGCAAGFAHEVSPHFFHEASESAWHSPPPILSWSLNIRKYKSLTSCSSSFPRP